jgi:hypothetical protein
VLLGLDPGPVDAEIGGAIARVARDRLFLMRQT